MTLAEARAAAWEATSGIAMMERTAYGRWDRPRPGGDFHDAAIPRVLHHHAAGVAGQAPGRFRGNVFATRLAAMIRAERCQVSTFRYAGLNLRAFINQVEAFVRTSKLTEAQGQGLIDAAGAIITELGE